MLTSRHPASWRVDEARPRTTAARSPRAFLTAMCPSLPQVMHQTECAFALPAPSRVEEEADLDFNWEAPLYITPHTCAALRLMLLAMI
jgi:hypothetical protein